MTTKIRFSTLCANTADDKMMIFFLFFPENRLCRFAKKTKDYFQGKIRKYYKMMCADMSTQHAKR